MAAACMKVQALPWMQHEARHTACSGCQRQPKQGEERKRELWCDLQDRLVWSVAKGDIAECNGMTARRVLRREVYSIFPVLQQQVASAVIHCLPALHIAMIIIIMVRMKT